MILYGSFHWRINTLRPRQNGRHFGEDTLKRIFFNEKVRILLKVSLKLVPRGPINNSPSLIQIMAWRRLGDKPLSEPMVVSLLTHICISRPQWVKSHYENLPFVVVMFIWNRTARHLQEDHIWIKSYYATLVANNVANRVIFDISLQHDVPSWYDQMWKERYNFHLENYI